MYVMAGGNGGRVDDNCGADGYVQSEYTISVNVVNLIGERTFYDEKCAGLTASVYLGSSGDTDRATLKALQDNERLAAEAKFSSRYGIGEKSSCAYIEISMYSTLLVLYYEHSTV